MLTMTVDQRQRRVLLYKSYSHTFPYSFSRLFYTVCLHSLCVIYGKLCSTAELDMGPFLLTQSNPIHKYLVLKPTRKL